MIWINIICYFNDQINHLVFVKNEKWLENIFKQRCMRKSVVVVNWPHMSFFIAAKVSVPIDLVSEVSSLRIILSYFLFCLSVLAK